MSHPKNMGLPLVDAAHADRCRHCGGDTRRQTSDIWALLHEAIDGINQLKTAMPSGRRLGYYTAPLIQPRLGESWQDAMDSPLAPGE